MLVPALLGAHPVNRLVHCGDIERSLLLLPLDDGGGQQRRASRFNILPGSPSVRRRFAALALSSYGGQRAATHHALHAPCDLSPASGPLCTLTMPLCARLLPACVSAYESWASGRPQMLPTGACLPACLPGVSLISSDRRASPASQPAHAHIRAILPTLSGLNLPQ